MNESEIYDLEGRTYLSPTLSSGEQTAFLDTLRNTTAKNTAQANRETQALGTDIPSNLGGLTGSEGYFSQRYQTTPVEYQLNTLKAAAQAKALTDLANNYQTQMKNRVTQAYRNAARRASSGGTTPATTADLSEGDIVIQTPTEYDQRGALNVEAGEGAPATTTLSSLDGYQFSYTNDGQVYYTNDPSWVQGADGYYHPRGKTYATPRSARTSSPGQQALTDASALNFVPTNRGNGGW